FQDLAVQARRVYADRQPWRDPAHREWQGPGPPRGSRAAGHAQLRARPQAAAHDGRLGRRRAGSACSLIFDQLRRRPIGCAGPGAEPPDPRAPLYRPAAGVPVRLGWDPGSAARVAWAAALERPPQDCFWRLLPGPLT